MSRVYVQSVKLDGFKVTCKQCDPPRDFVALQRPRVISMAKEHGRHHRTLKRNAAEQKLRRRQPRIRALFTQKEEGGVAGREEA